MELLHELLHHLSKDEKRLYSQHRREGRFQAIYSAYLAQDVFNKNIDKQVYAKDFADVSKPFYSMQKRSLLDDVVTVLLAYANLQHPKVNLVRALAKALLLLERHQAQAAMEYAQEARNLLAQGLEAEPTLQLLVLDVLKRCLAALPDTRFDDYEAVLEQEAALRQCLNQPNLTDVRMGLQLLLANAENLPHPERIRKADHLMATVQELPFNQPTHALEMERLKVEELYHSIQNDPVGFHQKLVRHYKTVEREHLQAPNARFLHLLNLVLRSGLRVGDFLLLTGLIYRTNKWLEEGQVDAELLPPFLADYYETAALYAFFEQDMPQALRDLEALLALPNLEPQQHLRCIYYRLGMLLAAHLALQALAEWPLYVKRFPELDTMLNFRLLYLLLMMDAQQDPDRIGTEADRLRHQLRKQNAPKALGETLSQVQAYLEHKPVKTKHHRLWPEAWEEILRVDYWLQAKLENQFYYNLVLEHWQERKQVIH